MDAVRPDSVLLAEHCHDATGDLLGDGWQGTMNYAGFTRPVWSWLTSSDNGLDVPGYAGRGAAPVRHRDRHHHAGFRRVGAVEGGLPALEPAQLARHPANPHGDRGPELGPRSGSRCR